MSNTLPFLYKLKKRDVKRAAEVFSRAFQEDLLAQYLFPDELFREKILPVYFNYRITFGVLYGEVYAPSAAIEGLAVWYLNDRFEMTNWRNFRAGGMKLSMKVDKETMKRMVSISHFSSQLRDEHSPKQYWYLAPIGIDPIHQGKGFASLLMRSMLARIDSEGLPCVLETQSEKNVKIYQKYAFEVVRKVFIPETTIPHWLMVREPQDC